MKERPVGVIKNEFLSELREAIPFLKQIPDEIYFRLDVGELHLPVGEIAQIRIKLEKILGYNIMTYDATIFNFDIPIEQQLCANVRGAKLTDEQLATLQDYEKKVKDKGVSFVAYQNPLELISPQESELFFQYYEKALI